MPSSYWEERAKQEKAWQLKQLENDAEFGKLLETYYNQAIEDISDSIEKELNRVGKDQVTQMDVKAYETKAKSIVAEAEKMRANGQKVTYADFSDQVNQRLKVYNATMRINRLEHLKSEVGLDMLRAGVKVDSSLRDKLSGDYQKEVIRQAGIMMDSAQRSPWTGKDAAKILMAQTNGATFSQRLWADQDALKAKLDQVLSVGMIQGQNPRKMAVRLREQVKTAVGNQRYVTERLARTESARIQTNVQLESIKKHGYNYVQWIAEPKACPACRAIASRDSGFGEGVYKVAKVPKIPDDTHPNCRCSISETWVDGKDDNLVGGKQSTRLKMMRRSTHQLKGNDHVPTDLMNQILGSFIRRGGSVQMGKETDEWLRSQGASASILDSSTILIGTFATEMAVREEAFHANQLKRYDGAPSDEELINMEIEAQIYLLKYAKEHNMSYNEIKELKRNLRYWKRKLADYKGR